MNSDFAATVLRWFRVNRRTLPWRDTGDAYAIWLSEIILQQTRVEQGLGYWQRFMRRWPTVELLAAATEDEVLREWQGLGYYSRARNLLTAARQIVSLGTFPKTLEGLKALKGVGDYTAAAIGSTAFGLPAAVVDGNVYRVLARHFGIDVPINTTEGKRTFATLAQELLPADRPGDYNQALMDFGAVQCTPQRPQCADCPLLETCDALRTGRVAELPVKLKKTKVSERRLLYTYIRFARETAIRRRLAGDIWQGLWEPPLVTPEELQQLTPPPQLLQAQVRHQLTHRRLVADFYLWQPTKRPTLPEGYIWIAERDFDDYAKPRLVERLLESLPSPQI